MERILTWTKRGSRSQPVTVGAVWKTGGEYSLVVICSEVQPCAEVAEFVDSIRAKPEGQQWIAVYCGDKKDPVFPELSGHRYGMVLKPTAPAAPAAPAPTDKPVRLTIGELAANARKLLNDIGFWRNRTCSQETFRDVCAVGQLAAIAELDPEIRSKLTEPLPF